jgi:hypothetical protein
VKTHLVKVRYGEGGRSVLCYCGITGSQHDPPSAIYRTPTGFLFHATAQHCTCMRCRKARKKSEARNEERN